MVLQHSIQVSAASKRAKLNTNTNTSCWGGMVEADEVTDDTLVGRGGMTALHACARTQRWRQEIYVSRICRNMRMLCNVQQYARR